MSVLAHVLGLPALAVLSWALVAIFFQWRPSAAWWFRPLAILIGAASAVALGSCATREFHFVTFVYLVLLGTLLIFHVILAAVGFGRREPATARRPAAVDVHPSLKTAAARERILDFAGAVTAYDEYLSESPGDVRVMSRLAEALIKAGSARRAISVLTVAFTEAQEPKMKIAFGIRLAEVVLVVERDPLAARAQLELLKKLYAGTGHEKYVEALSRKLTRHVAEGRYLKPKPRKSF